MAISNLSLVEKIILSVLYASKGKIRGKLLFQKVMFELSKAFEELEDELDFTAYSYGPFSEDLDEYRDMLQNSGLIENLSLTQMGWRLAKKEWAQLTESKKKIIEGVTIFFESLEDKELLLYIYATSPEMAEKSEVKEQILGQRIQLTLQMLRKEVISVGLAAKLAGLSINEISKKAIGIGIKPFDVNKDFEDTH